MRLTFTLGLLCLDCVAASAAMAPSPAAIRNMAPNPSFEQGEAVPTSWIAGDGASWTTGKARSGLRALSVSRSSAQAWQCERLAIEPGWSYRFNGWMQVRQGRAELGLDF